MEQNTGLVRVSLRHDRKPLPLATTKFPIGTVAIFKKEPELVLNVFGVPFLGDFDGAILAEDDAMSPTYQKGCILGVVKLKFHRVLCWGDCCYLIDKHYKCYLRRVYPGKSKDSILLVADNIDQTIYPLITKRWADIISVFKVKVCYAKESVSNT